MERWARFGLLGAALLLAALCGFALKGCLPQDPSVEVTTTVTASPNPTPTADPTEVPTGEPTEDPTAQPTVASGDGDPGTSGGGGGTFTVSGNVTTVLEPGVTASINVTITNPHARPIEVEALTVTVGTITAPHATPTFTCTAVDFSVDQVGGASPLVIPANASVTLADLGLAQADWPALTLLNRAVNQEGCKEATVQLVYGGTAVWGDA